MTKENTSETLYQQTEDTVPAEEAVLPESETAESTESEAIDPEENNWYVIHTYSGYEKKVCENLKMRIQTQNMRDQIFEVLMPVEEEVIYTTDNSTGNGKQKKRTIQKKIYPGYVFIQMKMSDRSWYVVRNTPGVTGFVSPGQKPVPLPKEEVEKLKQLMGLSVPKKVKIDLKVGQVVRITSGAFKDQQGTVIEVSPENEKIKLLMDMFGRETPTTVELGQVEKIEQ